MSTMDDICLSAGRREVRRLLALVTPEQRNFFDVIFPKGIGAMDLEKLGTAISLCERTIAKNGGDTP